MTGAAFVPLPVRIAQAPERFFAFAATVFNRGEQGGLHG